MVGEVEILLCQNLALKRMKKGGVDFRQKCLNFGLKAKSALRNTLNFSVFPPVQVSGLTSQFLPGVLLTTTNSRAIAGVPHRFKGVKLHALP